MQKIHNKKITEGAAWSEGMPKMVVKDDKILVVSQITGKYVDITNGDLIREFDKRFLKAHPVYTSRAYSSPITNMGVFELIGAIYASEANPISIPIYGTLKEMNNITNNIRIKRIEKLLDAYQKYKIIMPLH